MKIKILAEYDYLCGHRVSAWSVELDTGGWELHFSAPCGRCQAPIRDVLDSLFPGKEIIIE